MNSAERLEFRIIRDDQNRLHREVGELDRRITLLARHMNEPDPQPAETQPPPLPQLASILPAAIAEAEPLDDEPATTASLSPRLETEFIKPEPAPESADPAPETATNSEPLELRLGTYWMARIGIVILLTGLVFLGNYAYHRIIPILGAWGKLSLLGLAGVALGGLGAWLERSRETMRNYARVLLAGGAATIYYTAYAAHYVEGLRVIESPLLGGGLLLALAGSFIWWADRRRSEALAAPAVLLAYYTSAINPIGTFTLFSNLVLTAAAVFLLVRRSWMRLSALSLAATYGSYAFWRFHQVESGAGHAFGVGLIFVAAYWVLFTATAFLASAQALRGAQRVAFLSANNGAFFAFAAQHFAANQPDAFWIFALGYGVILLALAALAARVRSEELALDGAYLAQGLAFVTLGLAAKLTGPQLAIVLAVESAILLAGARRRHGWLYEVAAALCASGATGVALFQISNHTTAPLALGGPVTALLLFDAWWARRVRGVTAWFSKFAFGFAALGLVLLAALIWKVVAEPWQPAACAVVACVSLLALRVRLPEVALPAQTFLLMGLGIFVARYADSVPAPWWSPLPLLLAAIGLTHWWQRQRSVDLAEELRACSQLACAAVAAITGALWMHHFVSADGWLIATSGAALGTLLYGMLTRSWALALVGQAFTALAVSSFATALLLRHPSWATALAPILNVGLTSFVVARLTSARFPKMPAGLSAAKIAQCYESLALAMLGAWAFEYVTASWRVAWFAGFGATLLLVGTLERRRERLLSGAAYAAAAFVLFWLRSSQAGWADLLAILAVPAALRIGGWITGESPLLPELRNGLVLASMASLWLWETRWVFAHGYGDQLTTAWAVLALAIFAAGLGLRERIYRLGGFAILALALGRLFVIDVWRFDTLLRIVSFLVLGVVLLGLSFVYNRFSETMRRWL